MIRYLSDGRVDRSGWIDNFVSFGEANVDRSDLADALDVAHKALFDARKAYVSLPMAEGQHAMAVIINEVLDRIEE